jgi:hypothetical protein
MTNISCKHIVTIEKKKAQKGLKEWSKDVEVNEGKFVIII